MRAAVETRNRTSPGEHIAAQGETSPLQNILKQLIIRQIDIQTTDNQHTTCEFSQTHPKLLIKGRKTIRIVSGTITTIITPVKTIIPYRSNFISWTII